MADQLGITIRQPINLQITKVSSAGMQQSVYDPTGKQTDVYNRANHTGTQLASTISDFATAVQAAVGPSAVTSVAGRTGAVVLTKADVGLSNVDNVADVNKPVSTAVQTALNAKENAIIAGTNTQYWRGDKTWQTLDKISVGLNNVDNTSDANKPVSLAVQTALNGKEPLVTAGTTGQYYRGDKTFQTLDKTAVGLANVDNVSDLNKPISTATQTALNGKTSPSDVNTAIANATFSAAAITSGTLAAARMPAYTGDATSTAGTTALTLATVNSNTGNYGSATAVATFAVNGKGLTTAAGSVPIQIAESQVTNLTSDLSARVLKTGDTMTGALLVLYGGADAPGLQVDTRTSGLTNSPAFAINTPSTGAQKAVQATNGTDTFAWVSVEYGVGGASKPGIAFGGGTAARDVNIYRNAANVLKTDSSFVIGGTATIGTLAGMLKATGGVVSAAAAGTDYQAPITLTTTGTSGPATLTGNTLNIPQYSGGGGGGGGTVTSVSITTANGISGTVTNASTTPAITLALGDITPTSVSGISATKISYLTDVTSNIQGQINGKESAITAGTTAQYYRGDKTFQTLNTAAVTESTNLYYTDARVAASSAVTSRVLDLPDTPVNTAGAIAAGVNSGVTASGTYTAPTPAATVTAPPQRFAITNRTSSNVTLQIPNPAGTILNLTIFAGAVKTFRQVTTSGYINESGNDPTGQLDIRYMLTSVGVAGYITSGSGLAITGAGTTASPYSVALSSISGYVTAGANIAVSGSGTTASPYNVSLASIAGLISAGTNVTITGSGTTASPYVIASSGSGTAPDATTTSKGILQLTNDLDGSATAPTVIIGRMQYYNYVVNPSFEVDLTGWNTYGGVTVTRETGAGAPQGTANSTQTAASAVDGGLISATQFALIAGTYTLSWYMSLGSTVTRSATILRGTEGTKIQYNTSYSTVGNSNFNRYSQTFTLTGSGNYEILIGLGYSGTSPGTIKFDGLLLERASTASTYFDGSTPSSGLATYSWTGTANASQSIRTTKTQLTSTDFLSEGTTNQYFTAARAVTALGGASVGFGNISCANFFMQGSLRKNYASAAITTATTLTVNSPPINDVNATSAAVSITPPATTTAGYEFTITKIDSSANAVTLVGTFNGQSSPTLAAQWSYMTFVTTATSGVFRIISKT